MLFGVKKYVAHIVKPVLILKYMAQTGITVTSVI
jgi:hypothetical protein